MPVRFLFSFIAKVALAFASLLLSPSSGCSQSNAKFLHAIDSFQTIYQTVENDSLQLEGLTLVGHSYRYVNMDSSKYYLWKAIAMHKKKNVNRRMQAFAYNVIADIYRTEPNKDSARFYYQEAYQLFQAEEDKTYLLAIAPPYGYFLAKNHEQERGIQIFQEAIAIAQKKEDFHNLSFLYGSLGMIFYTEQRDNVRAIEVYRKGIKASDQMSDEINYQRIHSTILLGLSNIFLDEGQMDSTILYASKAAEMANAGEIPQKVVAAYNNLCESYLRKEEYALAKNFNLQAAELNNFVKDISATITTAIHTQALHLALRNYEACTAEGNNILTLYRASLSPKMKEQVYENLCECYVMLGDAKQSINAKDSFSHYAQQRLNKEQEASLAKLYNEFAIREQKIENESLRADQEEAEKLLQFQRYAAIGLILGLGFAIAWAITSHRSNLEKKKHNAELEHLVHQRTAELRMTNMDLQQSNYELRTLTYIASHDIKEPIRNIGTFAGLIQRKLPEKEREELRPEFQVIQKSAKRLYTLIEDFTHYISISKNKELPKEVVDLDAVIMAIQEEVTSEGKYEHGAIVNEGLPKIVSHPSAIYTIFRNLIDNGLKYNESETPLVSLSSRIEEGSVRILVVDNGIGIPDQYQNTIFEMFKRLHNQTNYQGSGVGLALVKLLLGKLGATIELESELQKGTCFILSFPQEA
ncbi:MAG: hypothetical protein KTR30_34530 [Saprospiraceae bacterium]|nr:hypothetical protein [Saprospiraceae bacterium]